MEGRNASAASGESRGWAHGPGGPTFARSGSSFRSRIGHPASAARSCVGCAGNDAWDSCASPDGAAYASASAHVGGSSDPQSHLGDSAHAARAARAGRASATCCARAAFLAAVELQWSVGERLCRRQSVSRAASREWTFELASSEPELLLELRAGARAARSGFDAITASGSACAAAFDASDSPAVDAILVDAASDAAASAIVSVAACGLRHRAAFSQQQSFGS
jgi:hypothetical protein